MPCFHTHWLVALEALQSAPPEFAYLREGMSNYLDKGKQYRIDCIQAMKSTRPKPNLAAAFEGWAKALSRADREDQSITCFSAYMLGACGPDFWQLPSEPTSGPLPAMAPTHFDLGHYNRSHRQFELSVAEVGGPGHESIQARAQRAYFLGMATHVAADLVIHQLVNVTAGAYNLLEHKSSVRKWENEHGGDYGFNIWNSHNKVEHYWDTYVRYRYLGDHGPLWGDDRDTVLPPYQLPTIEGLVRAVGPDALPHLRDPKLRYAIEKPLMFPWVFCDQVLAGQVEPFVYRIVVHKNHGAYPTAALTGRLRLLAGKEALSRQMVGVKGALNEGKKLEYFSSKVNLDDQPLSFNYLTFRVCPNVMHTQAYGRASFYDIHALEPFVSKGIGVAATFVQALSAAYTSGKVADLGVLRRFWNLDTGLGLRIKNLASDASCEKITELEFVHILDELGGTPRYVRREPYVDGKPRERFQLKPERAFKTHHPQEPFPDISSIEESDPSTYLEWISVASAHEAAGTQKPASALTARLKPQNDFTLRDIRERLHLYMTVAIADLTFAANGQYGEPLALFFMGDRTKRPKAAWDEKTADWLKEESAVLDYSINPIRQDGGLQFFATRLLVNTKHETAAQAEAAQRKLVKGQWNNVIPYAAHAGHYGRNFAIGTGRKHVLHPTVGGSFQPNIRFSVYDNLSPTEHVFFTLYPFVRERGVYFDLFGKTTMTPAEFEETKKISGCGTVKIVLVYERDRTGGVVLRKAWADNLKIPIEEG